MYYAFSIFVPGLNDGNFTLTCGTDCDTSVEIKIGGTYHYEELTGQIAPVPEPSTMVLLGTGVLGMLGVVRRRFVLLLEGLREVVPEAIRLKLRLQRLDRAWR